jgi:DDB1- and CUL4-associated factor 7
MLSNTNTAPQIPTLPNLPQISTQMQQQQQQRPATMSHSHSYSRSSPGLMEQTKYKPFTNTPEQNKYNSPTSYGPQTPQGPPSYSPLGLADIRPRADTTLSDTTPYTPALTTDTDIMQYPTNSNYVAQWPIYAVDWCKWPPRSNSSSAGKIAIGSYLEDGHNYIQVLDAAITNSDPEPGFEFVKTAEATHAYPVTRILWEPPSSNKQTTDLLATSGDHLRLWSLPADPTTAYMTSSITRKENQLPVQKLSPLALLSNSKSPEHTAPITSLDWNVVQPSLIITSSIDTTCTIWDIPTLTAKTQLIAHDKEVYDVR